MSDTKISELPAAGALDREHLLAVVQPEGTRRATLGALADFVAEQPLSALAIEGAAQIAAIAAAGDGIIDDATVQADRSEAAAAAAALEKAEAQTARTEAQAASVSTAADAAATAADRVQTGADRTAAANSAAAAQAIAFGAVIDAKGNLVIGTGAQGPADVAGNSDGNSVVLGTGAGVGLSQTFSRKSHAIGSAAMVNFRGYAGVGIGAYTGARGVADYGTFVGTHAGQDTNQNARLIPGFGARATGSITFSAAPSAGDTVTVNGVTLTVAASPANAYQFAPGASASEAAANLLRCLNGLTDVAIRLGYYRRDSTTAAVVNVASTSTGTYGNSFTLAESGANIAVSGATLTGGTDYSNSGVPNTYSGDTGVGFGALGGTSRPTTRRAQLVATMPSNPADGAAFRVGFNLTATITFRTTPVGPLDIQIGATVAETLANLVATLNGSANTTVDDVTYWSQNGVLFIEHDSNNVNTWEVRSYTSALVFPRFTVRGGASNVAANFGAGQSALLQSVTSNSFGFGTQSGAFCTGPNRVTFGNSSTIGSNGRDWFVWGENALSYSSGDDVIALGRGINSGAQDAWLAIVSMTADGTITFAAPHGWTDGDIHSCVWRDRATSGAALQRTAVGGSSWVNIPTSINGIFLQPINAMQARIVEGLPEANGGGRNFDYRTTGTAANIDVARFDQRVGRSVTLGASAVAREGTMSFGSSLYRNGMRVDAVGLFISAGELRPPQVTTGGSWPTGHIQFAAANGNFAADETVTLNGTVFTAKAAATFATPNSSMIRWFRIGADMHESLCNLLACIRDSDDQSAAARAVNQGRFWLAAVSGTGWRLHFQAYDSAGASYTLSTSKTGATVVSPTGAVTGLGNASSTNPPQDRGIVQIPTSPARNGNPGLATYNLATDSWRLV